MSMRIVLVRHGVSEGNLRHATCGQTDVPLAPEGIDGIRDLRARGVYPPTDLHFSSPLTRCLQTFQLAYAPEVLIDGVLDGFKEVSFGEMEGKTLTPGQRCEFLDRWLVGRPYDAEGLESCEDLRERAFGAVRDLVARMEAAEARSATVVTHSYLMRAALTRLAGLSPNHWFDFDLPNGMGYVLDVVPEPFAAGESGLARAVPFGPAPRDARRPVLEGPACKDGER